MKVRKVSEFSAYERDEKENKRLKDLQRLKIHICERAFKKQLDLSYDVVFAVVSQQIGIAEVMTALECLSDVGTQAVYCMSSYGTVFSVQGGSMFRLCTWEFLDEDNIEVGLDLQKTEVIEQLLKIFVRDDEKKNKR